MKTASLWPKSIFLIPYFGNFPAYFPYWLRSCETNTDSFEWIIYHDKATEPYELNKAVRVIPYTPENLRVDFRECYGFDIPAKYDPRKLCEFSFLLYDLRKEKDHLECEYFGLTDLDMIYGNINAALPERKDYPWVSAHPGRLCGPFTLFHKRCRERLRQYPSFQKIFQDSNYIGLDESAEYGQFLAQDEEAFSQPDKLQPSRSKFMNKRKTHACWRDGKIIVSDGDHTQEAGFFHFSKFKHKKRFKYDPSAETSSQMVIDRRGIWNPDKFSNTWKRVLLKLHV